MIEGSSEITGANPPGSPSQLAALEGIWKRHGLLEDGAKLATAVMSLVAARDQASEQARIRDEQLIELRGTKNGLAAELQRVHAEGERLAVQNEALKQQAAELERAKDDLSAEVARINQILGTITNSRTWRLRGFLRGLVGRS
jgi:chromosome segregation ATPase